MHKYESKKMIERRDSVETTVPTCRLIRPNKVYEGKQMLTYVSGISAESVRAKAICMHLLTMPPGGRAKAHYHENHETAIYVISGESAMWYGEKLEEQMTVQAGDMIYIPAGVPHLPYNPGNEPCHVVIARTDPNEQESVVLLPELE